MQTKQKTKRKAAPPAVSTGFWLMKSEPGSYSIEMFERDRKTLWTGVRNFQARNFMMVSMKPSDQFLFYHSSSEPAGVVGVGEITRVNIPDPTSTADEKSAWFCAEVSFKGALKEIVTLASIRETKELQKMVLLQRGQRLSIQQVTKAEFQLIVKMGGGVR